MKKALEAFWSGRLEEPELWDVFKDVEMQGIQAQAGIDRVGVGDVTLYDHVLDWALAFGLIPARFRHLEGLDLTFAMARGREGIPPLELTKWFDTNYHYLVPEIEPDMIPHARFENYLSAIKRAKAQIGERVSPIVLGPITLLALARLDQDWKAALESLLPLYRQLMAELGKIGVPEVQIHEPALVLGRALDWEASYRTACEAIAEVAPPINLVSSFDDLGQAFPWVVDLPVSVLSLDFTRGDNLGLIRKHGWPEGLTLGAGVVDGRSVWAIRAGEVLPLLEELQAAAPLRVGPSSSMMFVPYSAAKEKKLPPALRGALAFADEKLREVQLLARVAAGETLDGEMEALEQRWASLLSAGHQSGDPEPWAEESFERQSPYAQRRKVQIQLPPFPSTTIGSFPQTTAIRALRAKHSSGGISLEEYQAGIDAWIGYTIGAQEGLGLDVLVHGEFERSDMVEFFADRLEGIAITQHGWVQSYGNRYVRPPIIWSDVRRTAPMTVREFKVGHSFTERPVKGMLTGPVTILNWSFPRVDIPRQEIAFQIAMALREEIADLEAAGARVIQVDEPALREGMPLKPERVQEYLTWAVDAFRLATAGASDATQVHTHMCYADFGDILEAIERMDADVISIENARSGDEGLLQLAASGFAREVGPGVYDVHSVSVPTMEEIRARLEGYLGHLSPDRIWVNPDCGLKTRAWDEVLPSLGNVMAAVHDLRKAYAMQEEGSPAGNGRGSRA